MENTLQDIKKTVVFDAPIEKVWKAVSSSEGIASWFMPNDFQAEVGYEFHIQSPFGPSPCKVLKIEEPHHLSFSWDTDGWFVSFDLKDLGNRTEFTMVHGGWKQADHIVPKAGRSASEVRDTMNGGWEGLVNQRLRKVVEG
ncbi:SRPBCC domain-containing protein [Bacillus sp. S/N-304-OC-R1]|uniref:SRPBCC family protein n=1 Tax=Bacillus sp. S/N-304-OC-R1 TaxID=2758034 RepID=UPI001C8D37D6|nr:SRPBCC domain-containing protein [Bacillus sp. S/N-304-OC-R1]MBY0123684.1 SRPBCC domain-containing protein [Bacillus sp. S/N-304-OC-R1]